jgi:hypothetical protein
MADYPFLLSDYKFLSHIIHILTKLIICLLTIMCCCGQGMADENVLLRSETKIPRGLSRKYTFTVYLKKDSTVLLDIIARIESKNLGGSNCIMKILINGKTVAAAKTRMTDRPINRHLFSQVTFKTYGSWFGNRGWRVPYAPNFKAAMNQRYYEGNPYRTILDITDLVVSDSKNTIEIYNSYHDRGRESTGSEHALVLKRLNICKKFNSKHMESACDEGTDKDVINRGSPGAGPASYLGEIMPGGGFKLKLGNRCLNFSSLISYPNGGFYELAPYEKLPTVFRGGYQASVYQMGDGGKIVVEGPDYRITRTIEFTPRKVQISDCVVNKRTSRKLGLLIENNLKVLGTCPRIRLAGIPDPSINRYYSPGNPSVYISFRKLGIGMICEDDIFRNQATLFFDRNTMTLGLRTDKLCLPEGGEYTLKWSVYPVASEDYYDFVNLVRKDWGANYTINGAWTFFSPGAILAAPIAKIRREYRKYGIKYACNWGGWIDREIDPRRIGFGAGLFEDYWAGYRKRLQMAAAKIHKAAPDCKVLAYYNAHRDTSINGEVRFRDSLMTDEKGNPLNSNWGGKYNLTNSMIATLNNSFGKKMIAAVNFYLKDIKVDGLYWDEMEGTVFGQPGETFNASDGYSCLLNPKTYNIEREIGINTIMEEKFKLEVIHHVRKLGGCLMGNGPTATKKILATNTPRMIEIQHNENWNYEGNLDSPLGYAGSCKDFGNWIRALKLATLLVGTRTDYGYDIQPYVFPFTPIELHAGYMLGKERIITTHSGSYGWPGSRSLVKVLYFNSIGKIVKKDFETKVGQEARTKIEVRKGEASILVRLPISVSPIKGQATFERVQYGPHGVQLDSKAIHGFILRIKSGDFKIHAGQRFELKIGNKVKTAKTSKTGIIKIIVGPRSDGQHLTVRAVKFLDMPSLNHNDKSRKTVARTTR